mgnify:FL=1
MLGLSQWSSEQNNWVVNLNMEHDNIHDNHSVNTNDDQLPHPSDNRLIYEAFVQSNPIVKKISTLLFNDDFSDLYTFATDINSISPDLVELQNIEFGVKLHQVVF